MVTDTELNWSVLDAVCRLEEVMEKGYGLDEKDKDSSGPSVILCIWSVLVEKFSKKDTRSDVKTLVGSGGVDWTWLILSNDKDDEDLVDDLGP